LLLLLATSSRCLAQEATTILHIRNKDNGEAVAYGNVNVYGPDKHNLLFTTVTDTLGNAYISIGAYPATIEVFAIGYDREALNITSPRSDISLKLTKRFSSLDEVVVTGVAAPVKPQNALAAYKIITEATIRAMGAVSLNEVLGNQLNINVSNDEVLGAGMRMQGLGGDKVKVMMNGVAVNGRENGNIDLGQINLFNVEKVEVVQGPMSVIYGSDALGGVVNVIEKQHRKPFEFQATGNYESIGKYNVNAGAARSWKKHTVSLSGGRNFFQGWRYKDTARMYNGDTVHPQRSLLFKPKEQYVASAGYQYRAASGFKLSFNTDFLKEKVTNRGMLLSFDPYQITAHDEYYRTSRLISRLSLEGKIGKGNWQMMNGFAYYHRIRNTYQTDLTTLDETLLTTSGMQDTSKFSDISSRGIYNNKFRYFELTAGYDVLLQQGYTKKISGDDHFINDYAAFAMTTLPFLAEDRLKIQLGVRASYNTKFRSPLIPSVNILYGPSKRMQLRASYARGFRAPSLKEMYLSFVDVNHQVYGNENLRTEVGNHLQLSLSDMLHSRGGNYTQLMITGFYNDVKNGIVLVPVHPEDPSSIEYQYANQAKQKNAIATLQTEGQQQNLHYMIGYSIAYTFAQDSFAAFAAHELSSSLSYFWLAAKTNISVFYKYTGAQPFLRANIDGSANYDGRQPEYHMLDASAERKFWNKRIGLTVGVKNILDVQTLNASGISTGGVHSGNGTLNFLPRSLFTTLRFTID